MKKVIKRLKAPTPKFWRVIRNMMIVIGSVSGVIMGVPDMPKFLVEFSKYGLVVGAIGTGLAQMTTENKDNDEEGYN